MVQHFHDIMILTFKTRKPVVIIKVDERGFSKRLLTKEWCHIHDHFIQYLQNDLVFMKK